MDEEEDTAISKQPKKSPLPLILVVVLVAVVAAVVVMLVLYFVKLKPEAGCDDVQTEVDACLQEVVDLEAAIANTQEEITQTETTILAFETSIEDLKEREKICLQEVGELETRYDGRTTQCPNFLPGMQLVMVAARNNKFAYPEVVYREDGTRLTTDPSTWILGDADYRETGAVFIEAADRLVANRWLCLDAANKVVLGDLTVAENPDRFAWVFTRNYSSISFGFKVQNYDTDQFLLYKEDITGALKMGTEGTSGHQHIWYSWNNTNLQCFLPDDTTG